MLDFYTDIFRFPNYLYVCERENGKTSFLVLGGQNNNVVDQYDGGYMWRIQDIFFEMVRMYQKGTDNLTREEKISLAKSMKRISNLCCARLKGLSTLSEQKEFLDGLEETERAQIAEQVKMYKDCRAFYSEYVYEG